MMEYQDYKKQFLKTLRDDAKLFGTSTEYEFIDHVLGLLTEHDEIQSPQRVNCGDKPGKNKRIMRIGGYSIDEADRSLVLFISDFVDLEETPKLTKTRVDELQKKMYFFLDEVCNGKINDYFDDSDEILKATAYIKRVFFNKEKDISEILKIRFLVLTNKELDTNLLKMDFSRNADNSKKQKRIQKLKYDSFNGKPLELEIWHLDRICELEQMGRSETVVIDFKDDFGSAGIPCLKGDIGSDLGYSAYIAIISGKLLADIYIEYGSKVLEGNVRAFLGTSGSKSVNSGIRRTINSNPKNFFTYNNGIATTAAKVDIEEKNGQLYITKIEDLQIINGGQTTASLAEAVLKKTNVSLDGIFVPMKLTVIEERGKQDEFGLTFYDKMVQNIAKYANSQNKVTAADLFSNDPYHIKMEQMSKRIFAQPSGSVVSVGWYYERSRKKYKQEQMSLKSADLERFLAKFPKERVITKEQMAMYLMAIEMKPNVVAKGKNYVIKEYNQNIREAYEKNQKMFSDFFYHKCIAAAIIYRTVDKYLEDHKDSAKYPTGFWYKAGGFKMDIVPYAISKIVSSIPDDLSIDWETIWNKQQLGWGFRKEIEIATRKANDFINNSHGIIVSEYCKKAKTWELFKEEKYTLSQVFLDELIPLSVVKKQEKASEADEVEAQERAKVVNFITLGYTVWNTVKVLAREKQIKLSYVDSDLFDRALKLLFENKFPYDGLKQMHYDMIQICNHVKAELENVGVNVKLICAQNPDISLELRKTILSLW